MEGTMKKVIFLFFLGTLILAGTVIAKTGEMEKVMGDLKVKISMNMMKADGGSHQADAGTEHHHAMGTNTLNISIVDSAGNPVTDAKVKLNYSMPPMDNMPPMKYTARAKLDGDSYNADLNLSMKGEWDILIYIKRPGEELAKFDFNIHVM
jgi:hypothetical protein